MYICKSLCIIYITCIYNAQAEFCAIIRMLKFYLACVYNLGFKCCIGGVKSWHDKKWYRYFLDTGIKICEKFSSHNTEADSHFVLIYSTSCILYIIPNLHYNLIRVRESKGKFSCYSHQANVKVTWTFLVGKMRRFMLNHFLHPTLMIWTQLDLFSIWTEAWTKWEGYVGVLAFCLERNQP